MPRLHFGNKLIDPDFVTFHLHNNIPKGYATIRSNQGQSQKLKIKKVFLEFLYGEEVAEALHLKYSSSAVSAPPNEIPKLFHYQHQPQKSYVIRQQLYTTQVHAARIETVVDCYEAAKRYGGTAVVDYTKRKPTRRGFFY
ncbi:hypothetical protein L1987_09489 [Smallanthus sonchifolius]|uniref:Uncharacterized protein n=1 Tax=Smallanthus sonchifolius TaxID=185202 RepID=A0ACB9JPP1_9ASTR|nr:hypothetical protein L1987_09489 [Smallanthus sonchifolius]